MAIEKGNKISANDILVALDNKIDKDGMTKTQVTTALGYVPPNNNITVTASKHTAKDGVVSDKRGITDGDEGTIGNGNVSKTYNWLNTREGVPAGTYTLQQLLQQIVDRSHVHTLTTQTVRGNCNCQCDCDCSDSDGS